MVSLAFSPYKEFRGALSPFSAHERAEDEDDKTNTSPEDLDRGICFGLFSQPSHDSTGILRLKRGFELG